ncbi:tripartite tricarboxylate transporter permease [Falsiroseomonas oryzae]|uniref:tripartite tricarboxylate transporter permease n=1 Tax=Falsiroseomonas oryzae TaxID=2766473 RepID=UPI0022EB3CE3|nr:tripartite tricarboxylate transporter permease [Roseomonas sp. MO-31]
MDLLDNIALGFGVALTLQNIAYAFVGCVLGTLIGVLPGIGPVATIAMLLPVTYALPPVSALIMLAGIYYGAQYGGSTTSILVNLPGESASVVTCIDGYQMARNGRAGAALAAAALASFLAGTVGTLLIAAFGPLLSELAFTFGQADYFALMVLGLVCAVVLASGSLLRAVGMILLGLLFGLVGRDVNTGIARYDLGRTELIDGIGFVVVALGMFGLGEIIANLSRREEKREVFARRVSGLWLTREEFRAATPAALRGSALGSFLGILPGGGPTISAFSAYTLEKRLAGQRGTFGAGDIRGVAGPEAANNAAAQTTFIPMLTLGIPPNATMALMVGALTLHNIQPGPQVMTQNPQLFWGLIASMWIGNLMLVVLNLPLIGLWVRLLQVPYRLMVPAILMFCMIGVWSLNGSSFDLLLMAFFAVLGFVMARLGCEGAPLLLGLILGPMMEESLRRALLLSRGDWSTFITRPISATLLAVALALLVAVLLPTLRRKREEAFREE